MAEKKPSAEEIFRKNQEEMSEMEKIMADILNDFSAETENINEEKPALASPVPPARTERAPKEPDTPKAAYVPEDNDGIFLSDTDRDSAEAYSQSLRREREEKSAKQKKKRSVNWTVVILVFCALLVIGSLMFKALREDLPNSFPGADNLFNRDTAADEDNPENLNPEDPENTLAPDVFIPTPDPEGENIKISEPGTIIIMSDTKEDEGDGASAAPVEHSFAVFVEDVSWTAAAKRCADMGGHLANVANQEELDEIIALAEEKGIEKLWIGCHRVNAGLVWENDEQIDFYRWGRGEPSGYDAGDKVTEDYVLLWKFNGEWVYNDSRDDPVKDYPAMYSGQIGFACEFGDGGQAPLPTADPNLDADGDGIPDSVVIDIKPDIPG